MYLTLLLWRFEVLPMYPFSCVTVQITGRAKSCDSQHTYWCYTLYYIQYKCKIVFIVLSIIYEFETYEAMYYVLPA